ncbi:hypothetical protein Tco_0241453 [Tanacetum coccineum]
MNTIANLSSSHVFCIIRSYTSVYTNSEPWRFYWGSDEESSHVGSPGVIVYGYDGLPMHLVAPPSPDYVPGPVHPPLPCTYIQMRHIFYTCSNFMRHQETYGQEDERDSF